MARKISKWLVIGAFIAFGIPVAATAPTARQEAIVEPPPPEIPAYLMPVGGCESKGSPDAPPTQYNADGSVIHGPGNNWGAFQINATAHAVRAKALGIDFMTREGNIAFAKILYAESGYKPWYQWSGHCWENDPRVDQEKLAEARAAL